MASNRGGKSNTFGTALGVVLSIVFLLVVMFFYPMTQGAKSVDGSIRWWGRVFGGAGSCIVSLGSNCPLNVTNDNEAPGVPGVGGVGGVGTANAGAPANKSPEVVTAYLGALEELHIAEAEDGKYNPAEWNVWAINSATMCSTRAEVLKAQGADVTTKDGSSHGCSVTGGTWVSPYDGQTIKVAQGEDVKAIRDGVQIDHVVPMKYAAEHGGNRGLLKRNHSSPMTRTNLSLYLNQHDELRGIIAPQSTCLSKVSSADTLRFGLIQSRSTI